MEKGTIIYIGGFELPDKNAAAHRVLSNAKVLRKIGYNVVFIDVNKDIPFNKAIIDFSKSIHGFECWSIPYPKVNKQWIHYLCNIDYFIKVTKKYNDIKAVICYNYQSVAFIKIKKYCKRNNIKIIADCTEWYSTKGASFVFKIIKGLDSFLRMRIIQKRLDGAIVISDYLKKYYRKCENILYVPPLVDLSEEKWKESYERNDEDIIKLVYAGSPGRDKDKLNLLIESLSKISGDFNYILNVVGITKQQYLMDHKEHKDILYDLNNKIKFLGRLSHRESLKQVKISDFSVLIRENTRMVKAGFPTKFVESISCGVPVISTKVSDLENYIIDGVNGFFININDNINSEFIIKKVLEMKRTDIENMKMYCKKTTGFNYENYVSMIEKFFYNI